MTRWIYTTALLIFGSPLFSQLHFSSISDVLKYADINSTVARQGNLQRKISEQETGIVRAGLLPRVNAFGTAEYAPIMATQIIPESAFGGQDGKFRKVQFGMPWNFSTGVKLSVPLINLEKWSQLKRAKLQSVETLWSQKAELENLHIRLAHWYYQALVAKEMIRLNQENIVVVNELIRILEERKRNGVLDPADFNRSKNLQLNVETAQEDYEKLWNQSIINLRSLLNIPGTVSIQLKDSVRMFDWPVQDDNANRIIHRPALKEAISKTEVAKQNVIESKRASLPKLSLSSRYLYNWQMNETQNIHFDVNTFGLRADYTLFNGGLLRRQQRKAELVLQSAYINQQQTESTLIEQQQEWWNYYTSAFGKKNILQAKVFAATDNLRIARLNLKEGVMEFDAFNNIFSEYTRAQMEELQNLTDGILYHLLLTHNIQEK
ncbi:MAG: TolC family protein [Flavitalea sp.]